MRNRLLATVAVATVVGFGGFAAAQSQMGGESNKGPAGATQQQKGGGTSGTQSGGQTPSPSAQSQGMEKGKQNERLGQGGNEQKGMTRGTQEQRGMQQKGAQEQRGTTTKGAQEQQRSTTQQGAQEQRGTNTGANVGTSGAAGTSVQLSEDQRSRIKTVVERGRGPRLSRSNVNFSISVGSRVPRTVHFVVLPDEIVRIVPQYRGFDYFLIEDEIVIVDPRTLEIIAIIPA